MTRRQALADAVEAGRAAERADVLAHIERKTSAVKRTGDRGDEGARLLGQRLAALRAGIEAGIHVGEANGG